MSKSGWTSLGSILEEQFTREAICNRPRSLETGFRQLDKILGGGLNPGLTVLGGSTGLGKSTFALQLAEQVSESAGGSPVLYFSLEMSNEWIAAKAISRRYFKKVRGAGGRGITANELLNPKTANQLSEGVWQAIGETRRAVTRNQRLYIIEGALSARRIVEMVLAFMADDRREGGGAPPLVIVDYLQILLPSTPIKTSAGVGKQVIEESLQIMVELVQHKVPIILISSLNRSSYDRPMQRDAFKETGSIEYSADVLLGLQYCACHETGGAKWDISEEENKSPRNVEISVLKQRYGGSGTAVKFHYYANYDYFEEEGAANDVPAAPLEQDAAAPEDAPIPGQRAEHKSEPFYINNTKLADEIRKGVPAGKRLSCEVFKGTITEYEISSPLSYFDCNVADAIYTLYKSNHRWFSSGQVLRVLSGDRKQTITKQKKKEITDSIERLRAAVIEIDCTAEMGIRATEPVVEGEKQVIQGPFLFADKIGDDKYRFDRTTAVLPLPLYQYGELTKQMIRFPDRLLTVYDSSKKISDTMENISIKRFLIRRLEVIRHPSGSRRTADGGLKRSRMRLISFQESGEIFSKIGVSPTAFQSKPVSAWNQKRRNVRQTVTKILDYYQQIGYITGYRETPTGIELPEKGNIADPWALTWQENSGQSSGQ